MGLLDRGGLLHGDVLDRVHCCDHGAVVAVDVAPVQRHLAPLIHDSTARAAEAEIYLSRGTGGTRRRKSASSASPPPVYYILTLSLVLWCCEMAFEAAVKAGNGLDDLEPGLRVVVALTRGNRLSVVSCCCCSRREILIRSFRPQIGPKKCAMFLLDPLRILN